MQGRQPTDMTPPGNLRPAQLGIVLVGRVVLGHVTATLADLAQRGFLRIDEVNGQAVPGWLLTDLRDQTADRDSLLRFEVTLLDGLFAPQPTVRLSDIGQGLVPVLNRFGHNSPVMPSGMAACTDGTGPSDPRATDSCSSRSMHSAVSCAR